MTICCASISKSNDESEFLTVYARRVENVYPVNINAARLKLRKNWCKVSTRTIKKHS